MDRVVLVFTKPPTPGRVKTRLAGVLGAEGAAELHEALLRDLLDGFVGSDFRVEVRWELAAGERPLELGLPWATQRGGDLGERLWAGLSQAAAAGSLVAAVGSDHPDLPGERVEHAFDALERDADVVLGPASDGGYYLIALRPSSLCPELFTDVPWSTPEVYAHTVARCQARGLRVATLPEAPDVDTPEDLAGLATRLANPGQEGQRTRTLLARWGLGGGA